MSSMFEHTLKLFFVEDPRNEVALVQQTLAQLCALVHRTLAKHFALVEDILPFSLELFLIFIKNYP